MQKNYFNQQDQRQVFICDQQAIYAMGCGQLVQAHPMCNGYRILTSLDELSNFNIGLSQGLLIIDCAMFDFETSAVKSSIKTELIFKGNATFARFYLFEKRIRLVFFR